VKARRKSPKKPSQNERITHSSYWIQFGLATVPVHAVIQKWTPKIGAAFVDAYARSIATKMALHEPVLVPQTNMEFCLQLVDALRQLHRDPKFRDDREIMWRLNMFTLQKGDDAGRIYESRALLNSWDRLKAESKVSISADAVKKRVFRWTKNEEWFSGELLAGRKKAARVPVE
jgi:hypothetical protein